MSVADKETFLVEETPRRNPVPLTLRGIRAMYAVTSTVAPWLAVRMATRMFLRPGRYPAPRRERAWGKTATHVRMTADGRELAGYRWGEGPTVLLVHGWAGRGLQMGGFAAPLVAAGYSALAIDLPAHGKSPGRTTFGFDCARALGDLCESITDLHAVVTHSFGGSCLLFAIVEGLHLPRAVFIAPGVTTATFFEGFSDIVGLPDRLTPLLRARILKLFAHERWDDFEVAAMGDALGKHVGATLVLHDAYDEEVRIDGIRELVSRSGARFLRTSGLGHRRILRNERVVEAVCSFVTSSE